MKGIIYTRVSSDEQVKGTSLEFQEELCRKYCQQRQIEVVEVYKEEGESAKDLSLKNRKKFLEALEYCRKNKNSITAFIVLRVDRFARNTEDHFSIRKILMGYGTTLYSVTEPIGNKPAEKFIETVLAGAAEYDNALRKQRCTDGMMARINQGIYPWKPPIGYKCLQNKKHGEKKTDADPPDENRFPIIQQALKMYSSGTYTQKNILDWLNQTGFVTEMGKKPCPQLVNRILEKNLKFYAGIIDNKWSGKEIEGLHKPMITKEEYFNIKMIWEGKYKPYHKVRKKDNPNFPLRGFVLCGDCLRPFTGAFSKGNGGFYAYYYCQNKSCPSYGKMIPKSTLENNFLQYLGKIIPDKKSFAFIKVAVQEIWEQKKNEYYSDRKRNINRIAQLEDKKQRIYEMREDGSYTKEEFIKRKENIEYELIKLKNERQDLSCDNFDIAAVFESAYKYICDLKNIWLKATSIERTRFEKMIFPEGIYYSRNKGYRTSKLCEIIRIKELLCGTKSHLVTPTGLSSNQFITELREFAEYEYPASNSGIC